MIKNDKFFLPPPNDGSDFKALFKHIVDAGAGRPLGDDGFHAGPWTPDLLAEAITRVDPKRTGVDLRTVQLWFQENEKGISATNIALLARVLSCGDSASTSEWVMALSSAQSRLVAKRRELKKAKPRPLPELTQDAAELVKPDIADEKDYKRRTLARRTEKLFGEGSPLNLSTSVFAGMSALGFLSYILGIHNVSFTRSDGVTKQVGFLWAANWTLVFTVFLPLFLAFVFELVNSWKHEKRKGLVDGAIEGSDSAWKRIIDASSGSFWAVFLICLLFAGVFQWIGVCLMPLIKGGGNYATDWGTVAIVRPEIVTIPVAIFFTALAYLYMSLSFYLFFAGLILLYSVINDFWKIRGAAKSRTLLDAGDLSDTGFWIMLWVFRCTLLGMLIATVMKLQSSYLASNGPSIIAWVISDLSSIFFERTDVHSRISYRMPTHYSSLLIAISTCFVFLYGVTRAGYGSHFKVALWKMTAVVALLFASYLSIDAFSGFTVLMFAGLLIAIYGLFDPAFGSGRASEVSNQSVS
ncbi:RcgA family putative transporter [Brucella pseudogrignonensis]|uniref:RcgA family putative transporter n=1 Tax=Brucella pseudogrignonensis TaxID=419475 RepID=UPI003ED07B0F